MPKNDRARSIFIKILVFSGLVGLSVVVIRPVQSALLHGMSLIKTNFIEKIESYTGLEIKYSSIRPTIFRSFDIRDIRISKNGKEILSVSRARIFVSLSDLLQGRKTAVRNIQIDRPVISFDLQKDREIFEIFSSLQNKRDDKEFFQQIGEFLPEKPDYRIRDFFITLTDGEMTYKVQNMNVDITGDGADLFLDGKLIAECIYSGVINRTFGVTSAVGINGVYSEEMKESRAEIDLLGIKGAEGAKEIFKARPVSAALLLKDRKVILQSPEKEEYPDFHLDINTENGNLQAAINLDNFTPASFVSFSDDWESVNHLLSMTLTGGAELERNSESLRYNIDFNGGELLEYDNTFVLRANGNEKKIIVDEFLLTATANKSGKAPFHGGLSFSGEAEFSPFTPAGTVVFDRFSISGEEYFNADFTVSSRRNEIVISSQTAASGAYALNDIDIRLFPSERDLVITAVALCGEDGALNIDAILNYRPMQLETSLNLDSFSLISLVELSRPFSSVINIPFFAKNVIAGTSIDTDIFFTTDFNQIVYNAPNVVVKKDDNLGVFSFSGNDRQFTLNEGVFYLNENEFMLSAMVNYSNPMDLGFSIYANYLDFSWNVQGQILDKATLIIRDPNGLHVYGSAADSGAVSGYIEGVDFPVPVKSQPLYLNFYLTLRYNSKDFWSLDVSRFEVRNLNSAFSEDVLRITGSADQDGARFRELLYTDKTNILTGSADFAWNRDFSYIQVFLNMTDGRKDGEYYFFEGSMKEKHFNIRADVSQMRLDRFFTRSDMALVNGEIEASWDSIQAFNARLKLASFYARLQDNVVQGSAAVNFDNDELTVSDLKFDYAGIKAVLPEFKLNRIESFAKASVDIQGHPYKKRLETKIEMDVNFDYMDSWLDIDKALNSISGSVKTDKISYDETEQEPFAFVFARNEGELSVSGGPKNMLRLDMDREGIFFASLSSPFPIHGSAAGRYKDGIIDGTCNDFFLDLSSLWDLVSTVDKFKIDGGYITGKIDVRGPILNPEFFGSVRGTSLRFQVPDYVTHDIRPVPFNAVVQGNEITFGPISAAVGSGAATANGWLQFENWKPNSIGLDITIPRESPVPYGISVKNFVANGDVSGKLVMTISDMPDTNKSFEIKGDFFANNTEMGLSFEESAPLAAEDVSEGRVSVIANITVTTGPTVEFVWPDSNPILRGNPELGTVMIINADTQSGQYSINSDAKIRSGEMSYMDRSFYIRQGSLVFRENEQQFSPRLTARAELRDRTDSGPVTITMIIENEPLLKFVPRFEALPALTQLEIYTLLGGYMANFNGNEDIDQTQRLIVTSATDILTQFLSNTDIFSQFISVRQFERQIRNLLGLDMFSVRTRVLQNAVSNAAVQGLTPVDRNSRVGNYFDNTTVFMGKYVGQDMFIQGMLSMRYDENNLNLGGLKLEPDIGIELQSPFFNIRWDFFPYHPENWWVNDNSITLIWSRSF